MSTRSAKLPSHIFSALEIAANQEMNSLTHLPRLTGAYLVYRG